MVRFKNRYILFEVSPDNISPFEAFNVNGNEIYHAIVNATEQIHGEYGAAAIRNGLDVKYVNEYTRIGIVRARHGPHRLMWSSLPFVSKIGKKSAKLCGIFTGATILKCQHFLQRYQQRKLEELLRNCRTDDQRKTITSVIRGSLRKNFSSSEYSVD